MYLLSFYIVLFLVQVFPQLSRCKDQRAHYCRFVESYAMYVISYTVIQLHLPLVSFRIRIRLNLFYTHSALIVSTATPLISTTHGLIALHEN
jgi:hypothetical protein